MKNKSNSIHWYEGMHVTPHHFQQTDLRTDLITSIQNQFLTPYFWGVENLTWEKNSLLTGQIQITSAQFFLEDGFYHHFEQSDDFNLKLNILPLTQGNIRGETVIYLVLPNQREGGKNMTSSNPRYILDSKQDVVDENTGSHTLKISKLIPNLKLMSEKEEKKLTHPSQKIPLLKVKWENQNFTIKNFDPPHINLTSKSHTGQLCISIAQKMRQKLLYIHEHGHQKNNYFYTFMNVIPNMLLELEELLDSNKSHPYTIYRVLCQIAGQITQVRCSFIPPRFQAYNHNDMLESFTLIANYIFECLDYVQEKYSMLPFLHENNAFNLSFKPEYAASRISLSINANSQNICEKELSTWAQKCAIVSESFIDAIHERRIRGIERIIERVYKRHSTTVIISFSQEDPFFKADEKLHIFNVDDKNKTPQEIILYIPIENIKKKKDNLEPVSNDPEKKN